MVGASGSSSSLSFSKPEVLVGSKLSAAQTELQACEQHLAMKERELENLRSSAIKTGLEARCKALVECGWTWGEMGKEGLRALESGAEITHGHHGVYPHPFPGHNSDSGHAPSDLSSIAPSQSASQIALSSGDDTVHTDSWHSPPPNSMSTPPKSYTFHIPPAHAISESALPNGRPSATWRISEVEEPESGGSSVEEDVEGIGAVEVHENERFSKGKRGTKGGSTVTNSSPQRAFSIRAPKESVDDEHHVQFPERQPLADPPPSPSKKKERQRNGSMSLFGRSIAALFHHREKNASNGDGRESEAATSSGSRWQTRTDKHLARAKRGEDSSDDERPVRPSLVQQYSTWSPANPALSGDAPRSRTQSKSKSTSVVSSPSDPTGLHGSQRLKKRPTKRNSAQVRPTARPESADKGWVSDGASVSGADAKSKRPPSVKKKASATGSVKSKVNGNGNAATASAPSEPGTPKARSAAASDRHPADPSSFQTSLSRNSSLSKQSMTSAASAPVRALPRSSTNPPTVSSSQSASSTLNPRKRTTSIEIADPASGPNHIPPIHTPGHKRGHSVSSAHRSGLTRDNDGPSLMSIVEGVAKQNRSAWAQQDPNRMLVLPKAPPPVTVNMELEEARQKPVNIVLGPPTLPSPAGRGSPLRDHAHMSASASAPSLPISTKRPTPKLPLRSALRNSRTPSPNPLPPVARSSNDGLVGGGTAPGGATIVRTASPLSLTIPITNEDDAASISSYETGHEDFDEEPELSAVPPPPPPHDEKLDTSVTIGSDLSSSTATTATAPVRRKSVRMSLPPTFSATPPALDDNDEETRGRYNPWSSSSVRAEPSSARSTGWTTRIDQNGTRDAWQDSSDEDEEYRTAKRLLNRLSRPAR